MSVPTCVFISFMVLLSLAICSAQPVDVQKIKSKETDHHNHKAHTLSNIDVEGFGGIGGGGGGGGFGIGTGGGRFGIGIGGGGGFDFGISGGIPAYTVPGYGSPIYIPGFNFPVYSHGCGYVCPANNPSGEITALKISGLSHFTRPYRCRPGPNMRVNKDYNSELLLHSVSTMQDKHENKHERPHYGGHGGDVGLHVGGGRRLGFGRGSGKGTGGFDTSEYNIKDPGCGIYGCRDPSYGFNTGFGCGYVCPGNGPSGGITEFHISGLSHFNGPYRCRPDMCDSEHCGEFLLHFVSPKHDKYENQHGHPVERSEEKEAGHRSEQQEEEIIN